MQPPGNVTSAMSDIMERAEAAFLGVAVGDALGAPVEFMTAHEIKARYGVIDEMVGGGWLRLKPGDVTDDTQMSLCIARAIRSTGGWFLPSIADNFAAWLKSKPVDVGDTCRRGIRNYMLKGELQTPYNEWDAGNGAAMRVLPAALYSLGDDGLLEKCAVDQARITHNHPLSDAACVTLGKMVHLAITGGSKVHLRREVQQMTDRYPAFAFEPYRGLATGYVVDTLQTVFHYFFRSRSFEECIVRTVNQGGDADTTGAIAGMVAGAYYGKEGIPPRWLKKLGKGLVNEVKDLARHVVLRSPLIKDRG